MEINENENHKLYGDRSRSSLQEIGTLSKVTDLRKRFESFKNEPGEIAITKAKLKPPTPPKKNCLIRSETMRDSTLIENRKGLAAKYFKEDTDFYVSKFDSPDDVIYDNVPNSPFNENDPQ